MNYVVYDIDLLTELLSEVRRAAGALAIEWLPLAVAIAIIPLLVSVALIFSNKSS